MVHEQNGVIAHIFFAIVASDEHQLIASLQSRVLIGPTAFVAIRRGFDPSEPVTLSLLSEASANVLSQIQDAPTSPLARGFSLFISHGFEE
ncbi:hypothetical protein E2493_06680 [Sphingomonas parva]|uniref:Uncharacterized protein n=1 Tax=Sphingomonas parva TaxID=2555898 RepID=A0A4Y8ZT61_9SPHN|nr:hypothetical protein [Sphingomonas parva]TFI59200.1 hypothetical protein E2493_06680 [Sphingomonas parva]